MRQPLGVAGPDHRRQHADRERRVEGLPGADVRQRGRAEGVRGHAGDRARVRAPGRRGRAAARACSTSSTASAPEAGQPLVEDPRRRDRLVHRLDRRRAHDRPRGRRAAGQGLPRARRQEPAGGLRRRRPRERAATPPRCRAYSNAGQRCAAGSRIIVFDAVYDEFKALLLERTNAQRVGPGDERRPRPGDQRAPAREHARATSASAQGEGRHRAGRRPPASDRRRLLHGADADRELRRELDAQRAVRPDHDAAPRRAASRRRSSSPTRRPTA